jgi:hypothetical protein
MYTTHNFRILGWMALELCLSPVGMSNMLLLLIADINVWYWGSVQICKFNWNLWSCSKFRGCTSVMPTFDCVIGCFFCKSVLQLWIPLLSPHFCILLCSIWRTIFIGFAGWLRWDPDSRTLPVYSVSATSKVTAGFPLSSRPGVCSISRLCVVPAGGSTDTADSYSSGGQTVPACSQTYGMYNDQDEIVYNIWNSL